MTATLFDQAASRAARDNGIVKVMGHNGPWAEALARFVRDHLPAGWTGNTEDIRRRWLDHGTYVEPTGANAWGGAIGGLVRNGWLAKTGRLKQNIGLASHARDAKEYVRTDKP